MRITMKQLQKVSLLAAVAMLLAACVGPLGAQTVVNGDFEADLGAWVTWPGYAANGANPAEITGWTGTGGRGINPVVPDGAGDKPFRDNGNNTTAIAFLQGTSSIQQTVSGFVVGQPYVLSLDFNSRDCCGDSPIGEIYLNDILAGSSEGLFPPPGVVPPVGGANPWYHADIDFDAPVDTITLRIAARPGAGGTGDATLLVDNVHFTLVPEPTSGVLGLLSVLGLLVARRR
jgi:hypothetical protein